MHPWMYVVLLGLLLIVYARFLPKKEETAAKANVVQEIEETIEHFAAEMDEQNQAILDLFARTKQDYEVELAKLSGRMETLERQKAELSKELTGLQTSRQVGVADAAAAPVNQPAAQVNMALLAKPAPAAPEPAQPVELPTEEPAAEVKPQLSLSMKTRYAELFSLYEQGKGVEAIAKKLGMNKGEVSLILQLSRQEEQSRV